MQTTPTKYPNAPIPAGCILEVGDKVSHTTHTDCKAALVTKVSPNGKTAIVQYCNQTLLNGITSGEPDALTFTAGGFCGHTQGNQRWQVEPNPEGTLAKFTLRKRGAFWQWKLAGTGANQSGNFLKKGHTPYYDFNF